MNKNFWRGGGRGEKRGGSSKGVQGWRDLRSSQGRDGHDDDILMYLPIDILSLFSHSGHKEVKFNYFGS